MKGKRQEDVWKRKSCVGSFYYFEEKKSCGATRTRRKSYHVRYTTRDARGSAWALRTTKWILSIWFFITSRRKGRKKMKFYPLQVSFIRMRGRNFSRNYWLNYSFRTVEKSWSVLKRNPYNLLLKYIRLSKHVVYPVWLNFFDGSSLSLETAQQTWLL